MRRSQLLFVGFLSTILAGSLSLLLTAGRARAATFTRVDVVGQVADSVTAQPIPSTDVAIVADGKVVAHTTTDAFGHFEMHAIPVGAYRIQATLLGYRPARTDVMLSGSDATLTVNLQLASQPIQMQTVEVGAHSPMAVDTRTGEQIFQQQDYHGAPTTSATQILQQSIAGAVRAPTSEVHIRGQHAEYTYYIDGVPVTTGISGGLNELFDPDIANQIRFETGSWDAEYGNKNTAVILVASKVPTGSLHVRASATAGSFDTQVQDLQVSSRSGPFGFVLTGSRQVTDMRQEPVVFNQATLEPINFHNHGEDLFGFGKVQWLPGTHDFVNLDLNLSRTRLEVPYDSTGGVTLDDNQHEVNGFENLSWQHEFGSVSASRATLFVGVFHRHGSLDYLPGATDDPQFVFYPDTTLLNVEEHRNFHTTGLKMDYTARPSHDVEWAVGIQPSVTTGREDFTSTDGSGNPGPASNSDLNGHDFGVFAQTVLLPREVFEIRAGVRYDVHHAPFAGSLDQVSPRLKLSWLPDPGTSVWAYYGRLFVPTNIEDLRAITSVADSGVVAEPTLPERDDFYEAGVARRLPAGVVAKVSAYVKSSRPGIDDNTVPGSSIVTSVNIATVSVTGIEAAIEVHPGGPFSGYMNAAICHAYGHGPITGGFFPAATPGGNFDLDHDQRLSLLASLTWAEHRTFASVTGIYGSGLTNGQDPDASYGTGLFDFNRSIHVAPNGVVNASAGYAWPVGKVVLRPQLFVDNLFDTHYLLKGAFFSGASVGRPRSVQFKIEAAL